MIFDSSGSSFDTASAANSSNTGTTSCPGSSRVSYVSGPCGAGKTYATAQEIAKTIDERPSGAEPNYLYVGPSMRLLTEFAARLDPLGVNHRVIDSDSDPHQVIKTLMNHLKHFDGTGHVTLCTHSAFFGLPYHHKRDRWHIIIDEVPRIDYHFPFKVPQSGSRLAEWFEVWPVNEQISIIKARSKNQIDKLIATGDDMTDRFKDLFRKIRSPDYEVYTQSQSYDRVVNGRVGKGDEGRIDFLAVLKPEALQYTTILAANFESSMLYDWLKRRGCELVEDQRIKNQLRSSHYDKAIGERTTIRYVLEKGRYSKWFRGELDEDGSVIKGGQLDSSGRPIKLAINEAIQDHVGRRRCLLYANKDDYGLLRGVENVTVLPGSVGGLNCYDDHDLLIFVAALNRSPAHLRMLYHLGFSEDSIRHSTLIEQIHQSVMRTSLRRPDSSACVELIVPDKATAKEVGNIIGAVKIERLGQIERLENVDKLPPLTKAEKDRRYRFKKARDALCSDQQELRPSYPYKRNSRINHNVATSSHESDQTSDLTRRNEP